MLMSGSPHKISCCFRLWPAEAQLPSLGELQELVLLCAVVQVNAYCQAGHAFWSPDVTSIIGGWPSASCGVQQMKPLGVPGRVRCKRAAIET